MSLVKPDITFIEELSRISKSDLKACMQCGNCSVVCELAPEERPFPRKEMIWAGWGLKDKLINDPDIWLCHQCGDCTTSCPRGVKPSDVLAALRQMSYQSLTWPGFISKMIHTPVYLPMVVLFPAAVIMIVLMLAGTFTIPEGPVDYSAFFPHALLNSTFTALFFAVLLINLKRYSRFWKNIWAQDEKKEKTGFLKNFIPTLWDVSLHRNFTKCTAQSYRYPAHFLVFWGFVMLLVVTLFAIIATITDNYPLTLFSPVKIMGNLAALMLIAGTLIMIFQRAFNPEKAGHSTYADWLFLVSFFLLAVSGVLVEMARFLEWGLAYHLYFVHLVLVWMIIMYLPYTKFGHVVLRTMAMVRARIK